MMKHQANLVHKGTLTNRFYVRLYGDGRMVCKNQVSTYTPEELMNEGFYPMNEVVGARHMTYKMYILKRNAPNGETWFTATASLNKLRNFSNAGWITLFHYATPPLDDPTIFLTEEEIEELRGRLSEQIISKHA